MATAEQKQEGQHRDSSDFVITQTFDAPRELVFQSWVEPERLAQWWGPVGFELSVLALDLQPGGVFHYGISAGKDRLDFVIRRQAWQPRAAPRQRHLAAGIVQYHDPHRGKRQDDDDLALHAAQGDG